MTKAELIRALDEIDDDTEICVSVMHKGTGEILWHPLEPAIESYPREEIDPPCALLSYEESSWR